MSAILLTSRELTPAEYGAKHNMSTSTVKRRCEDGLIYGAYRVGNRWKIPLDDGDTVPRERYEALIRENAELKARLDSALRVLAG